MTQKLASSRVHRRLDVARLCAFVVFATALPGCRVIKGIFEGGFVVGVAVVLALVFLIGGGVALARR